MVTDWRDELAAWLTPFLAGLHHKTRARMCPAYVAGLIGPGDRKSIQPMAARDGGVSYDQLHHFVANGVWDAAPLEKALLAEADRQVGGDDAWLIIDDTTLPKKGRHSVGVAPQYASTLGKNANCQTMVSVTLASHEVPIMVGLRLFLPESWTSDPERLVRAGVMAGNLAERLPVIGMGSEFDQLSINLNHMLSRIESLIDGTRQVSNDIAHDLRTPLTRLRLHLESASAAKSLAACQNIIDEAKDQIDEIMSIFRALLRIGTIEAGMGRSQFREVDLSEVMNRVKGAGYANRHISN